LPGHDIPGTSTIISQVNIGFTVKSRSPTLSSPPFHE
jgi:hypothetical protein